MSLSQMLAIYSLLSAMLKRSLTLLIDASNMSLESKILLLDYAAALVITKQSVKKLAKNRKSYKKENLKVLKKALSICADYEIKLRIAGFSLDLH
tara:strand:+ start:574 stop:858 length:285 start_codon:yes stop_codon:yes gene_type:complete